MNNDLLYDITRCKNEISDGGIVIFANSRLVPTSGILKPVYRYGQLKGMNISTSQYKPNNKNTNSLYQAQISLEFLINHSFLLVLLPSR